MKVYVFPSGRAYKWKRTQPMVVYVFPTNFCRIWRPEQGPCGAEQVYEELGDQ